MERVKPTKQRILETARRLFNEKGLAEVSLRQIAHAAGMSQGNLNYHYPRREDVVMALYLQLVGRLDEQFENMSDAPPGMALVFESTRRTMELMLEYRFLMLDFVQVMRGHPEVLAHFRELRQIRDLQLRNIFQFLIASGTMQQESFPDQYENLFTRFNILGDFWIASAEIHSDLPDAEKPAWFALVMLESVFPLFTETGKAEFLILRQKWIEENKKN